MRRFSSLVIILVVILAGPAPQWGQERTSVPDNIKSLIGRSCSVSGCHTGRYPTGNLNLEPGRFLSSVLNASSQEARGRKIIDIAAPEKSYLLSKIKGEPGIVGVRMPAYRDPLPDAEIETIEAWVMGLKGAAAPDPAPRQTAFAKPAFWGTRLINLPTTETVESQRFLFRISHRFIPAVESGWDGFYGLDGPAFILLSFGYGITDRLTVTVGRTNFDQEWEFTGDYRLFEPSGKTGLPLSGALHVGAGVVTQDKPAGQEWSSRLRLSALFSLSWQVTDRISLLAVPGFASNANYFQPDSEGTFSLGLGGRALLFDDFSVIAEWLPVLAGYKDYINGWGLGMEKKIGGHIFHVFITNCYGLTAPQYMIGGDLGQFTTGVFDKFRLGFNIFRSF